MPDLSRQGRRPAGGSGRLEVADGGGDRPVVYICTSDFSTACNPDQGWTTGPWFSEGMFGQPVPPKIAAHYHSDCHHVFCAD